MPTLSPADIFEVVKKLLLLHQKAADGRRKSGQGFSATTFFLQLSLLVLRLLRAKPRAICKLAECFATELHPQAYYDHHDFLNFIMIWVKPESIVLLSFRDT